VLRQWREVIGLGKMRHMLSMCDLKPQDLQGLSPEAITALAAQMLKHIELQTRNLEIKQRLLERKDRDIAYRDAKIEKITFELTRLKRWKFGAKSEAMTAEQRQMFRETILEDEADLEAQLAALRAALPTETAKPKAPPRRPRRQALPDHLRRVEHHHEPEDTTCTTADCGQPMTRVGEDISERLDIVPAEFFVHRHIYGKWTCRCCQRQGVERLLQEPADPQLKASAEDAHLHVVECQWLDAVVADRCLHHAQRQPGRRRMLELQREHRLRYLEAADGRCDPGGQQLLGEVEDEGAREGFAREEPPDLILASRRCLDEVHAELAVRSDLGEQCVPHAHPVLAATHLGHHFHAGGVVDLQCATAHFQTQLAGELGLVASGGQRKGGADTDGVLVGKRKALGGQPLAQMRGLFVERERRNEKLR